MPSVDASLPPLNPDLGSVWPRPQDQMSMVYVPAGSFLMGSEDGSDDEKPVHEVTLDGFWIDRTEVSNEQFGQFVSDTGHETTAEKEGSGWIVVGESWEYAEGADWQHPQGPDSDLSNMEDHPVVLVSWEDADTYCDWAGGRLPSEAQWEYTARGPQSLIYPWGATFDGEKANFCDQNCVLEWKDESINDSFAQTAAVGSYQDGASWAGALDMAGNVGDWVSDWYGESYYTSSPQGNPEGPDDGDFKVLRGGSWLSRSIYLRGAYRNDDVLDSRYDSFGFRCALPGE